MNRSDKILWGEGLFLRPQHFQRQDAYHEWRLAETARTLHPYGWGLRELRIDSTALQCGMLRVDAVSAVFPDGEPYIAPGADPLPEPVALDPLLEGADDCVFHLALHPVKESGGNYGDQAGPCTARYIRVEAPAIDLYTNSVVGGVDYLRKHVRLLADGEPRGGLFSIPVARVRRNGSRGFELDDSFIAPSAAIQACPALLRLARQWLDMLEAKAHALYGLHREPSKNVIEFRSGDVASFWLLHTVNGAFGALSHLFQHAALHPERMFHEMLRLAGALLTFSKRHTLADLPAYVHEAPESGFRMLDRMVRDLLETVISTRCFSIALDETRPSFHIGRLDSGKVGPQTAFYLAVSAGIPASELIETIPLRFKAGAPDDVDKLVLSAMPGVPLAYAPQVPPAIPVRPGNTYFALQPRGPLYERMLQMQSIAIYAPAGIADLKLDLIAVTP